MFDFLSMFQYSFMVRALIGGILISLCAALLGVSLVLKRYSMIGDGLSHVGFGALAIGSAANFSPVEFALPIVIISAFFLLRISENSKIKGDAAIALISTGALAIGITVASLSGVNTDIDNYLFGSILALSSRDIIMCWVVFAIVMVLFILFYNKIFAVTFDESFAKATGTKTGIYNMLIAFLTALTIVIGMKLMGTLLISSLVIFPAITSMRIFKRFKTVIISSAVISVAGFFAGLVLSYNYSTPTGAGVVLVNLVILIVFFVVGYIRDKINIKKYSKGDPIAIQQKSSGLDISGKM